MKNVIGLVVRRHRHRGHGSSSANAGGVVADPGEAGAQAQPSSGGTSQPDAIEDTAALLESETIRWLMGPSLHPGSWHY